MPTDDGDDLVPFQDVRVIETSGSALLCRIGNRTVWLPRRHISGKLWCSGDRGKLFVRRWLARDLQLIDQRGEPISPLAPSIGISTRLATEFEKRPVPRAPTSASHSPSGARAAASRLRTPCSERPSRT